MAISKLQKRNKKKTEYFELIQKALIENGEQVLQINTHELSFPVVHEDGEEDFVVVTIKIPTGSNKGTEPFDGFEENKTFLLNQKLKTEKKAKAKAEKEKKIKQDEIYRAKKKADQEKREVSAS